MSAEEIKQDCERKAFIRLAGRIKKRFSRLPILLLADSLYASKPVMNLCRKYKWEFLIRYKKGSIPGIAEEYERIPEKGRTEKAEFVNDIDYEGKTVHVLRYREEKDGEITEFQWLSSMKITKGSDACQEENELNYPPKRENSVNTLSKVDKFRRKTKTVNNLFFVRNSLVYGRQKYFAV